MFDHKANSKTAFYQQGQFSFFFYNLQCLLFSFLVLIALATICCTMLNSGGENNSRYFCITQSQGESIQFFMFKHEVSCRFFNRCSLSSYGSSLFFPSFFKSLFLSLMLLFSYIMQVQLIFIHHRVSYTNYLSVFLILF